jgi:hypothetical protein
MMNDMVRQKQLLQLQELMESALVLALVLVWLLMSMLKLTMRTMKCAHM